MTPADESRRLRQTSFAAFMCFTSVYAAFSAKEPTQLDCAAQVVLEPPAGHTRAEKDARAQAVVLVGNFARDIVYFVCLRGATRAAADEGGGATDPLWRAA